MEVARHEGRMREAADDKGKLSVRGYLMQMAERGGPEGAKAEARLEGPEVPDALAYLWGWFLTLDETRTYGFSAPNPLGPDLIAAADALYGWGLDRMEIDAIRVLDGVVRNPEAGAEQAEPEPTQAPAWPTKKG